eukprot:1036225-Prorocentrum_minimum.AAC.1
MGVGSPLQEVEAAGLKLQHSSLGASGWSEWSRSGCQSGRGGRGRARSDLRRQATAQPAADAGARPTTSLELAVVARVRSRGPLASRATPHTGRTCSKGVASVRLLSRPTVPSRSPDHQRAGKAARVHTPSSATGRKLGGTTPRGIPPAEAARAAAEARAAGRGLPRADVVDDDDEMDDDMRWAIRESKVMEERARLEALLLAERLAAASGAGTSGQGTRFEEEEDDDMRRAIRESEVMEERRRLAAETLAAETFAYAGANSPEVVVEEEDDNDDEDMRRAIRESELEERRRQAAASGAGRGGQWDGGGVGPGDTARGRSSPRPSPRGGLAPSATPATRERERVQKWKDIGDLCSSDDGGDDDDDDDVQITGVVSVVVSVGGRSDGPAAARTP